MNRQTIGWKGAAVPPVEEDRICRDGELEAVLRKWRADAYSRRVMRAAWAKVSGLMMAAAAIFLWALALLVLIG